MLFLIPLIFNAVGILARGPDLRIVGGHPVSITERPFQTLIFRKGLIFMPGCGGSIIDKRWILTAAHCVIGIPAYAMFIRVGSDALLDDNDTRWYRVVKSIIHDDFDDNQWAMKNDIALLRTNANIQYSRKVQPIRLSRRSPHISDQVVISGFGAIRQGGRPMTAGLQEVTVSVLDRNTCVKLLADITHALGVSNTHFCAAQLDGGHDACQGDSGGPVTLDGTLVGIVSWGIGCGKRMVPAFYTDVAQFVPWIRRNVHKYYHRKFNCKQRDLRNYTMQSKLD